MRISGFGARLAAWQAWIRIGTSAAIIGGGGGCGIAKPSDAAPPFPGPDAAAGDVVPESISDGQDGAVAASGFIDVTTFRAGSADDGQCSLEEAVTASNTRAPVNTNDCPAGSGHDVLRLAEGTYLLDAALEPTASLEIRGAGMGRTTIAARDNRRACALYVAATIGTVRMTNLTLTRDSTRDSTQLSTADSTPDADAGGATAPDAGSVNLAGACVESGTLWLRHARVTGFAGGGLIARASGDASAKITVFNSLIDDNRSPGDGAGIAFTGAGSSIYVEQSAIVNNVSERWGGGVFGSGAALNTIKNSTISGNLARRGGGIAIAIQDQGYMALYSTTIADNRAMEIGGGIFQQAAAGDTVNTILNGDLVSNNVADGGPVEANLNADWGSNFTCTLSLLGVAGLARQPPNIANSCRYDVADARLGPLMNMGGVDGLPVHSLLPGSPAIDAIDATGSGEMAQQRDSWNASAGDPQIGPGSADTPAWSLFGRPSDGDGDGTAAEDMGAYEVDPRWETELLAVAQKSSDPHAVMTAPDGYSHGAGTNLAADAIGDFVTYTLPVAEIGIYDVGATVKTGGTAGRFQLSVADAPGGAYVPIGAEQDGYSSVDGWRTFGAAGVTMSSVGQKYFKFTVTGKNASSAGYEVFPDYIALVKQQ